MKPTAANATTFIDFAEAGTNENYDIWNVDGWWRNGDAKLDIVEALVPQRVLSVRRANTWDGISSDPGLFTPSGTYEFSMKAKLGAGGPKAADVRFELTDGANHEWVANTEVTADAWTTIDGTWRFAGDGANYRAYTASSDVPGFGEFEVLIDNLVIRCLDAGPDAGASIEQGAVVAPAPKGIVVMKLDFDDDCYLPCGWGNCEGAIERVPDPTGEGHVLAITRSADWHGLASPPGIFTPGHTYRFTADVVPGANAPTPLDIRFLGVPGFAWIGNTEVGSDWVTISGEWTVPDGAEENEVRLVAGNGRNDEFTFLADNVIIEDITGL